MKNPGLYGRVKFDRSSGLANRLFPWARCVLFCDRNSAEMLAPNWVVLRRGPILRGGKLTGGVPITNLIGKIFLFGNFSNNGYQHSPREYWRRRRAHVISEEAFDPANSENPTGPKIVEFSGCREYFLDLVGQSERLLKELEAITAPRLLDRVNSLSVPPVLLNIRVGRDLRHVETESDIIYKGGILTGGINTPVSWFCRSLERLRQAAGFDFPALVISDGGDDELEGVLNLGQITRASTATAIEDLLLLSRAKVIIGAGGSSFTAWGAFLAQAHVITIRGLDFSFFNLQGSNRGRIAAWEHEVDHLPHVDEIAQCALR